MRNAELLFVSDLINATYEPAVEGLFSFSEIKDCLSEGQLFSKAWLVDELKKVLQDEQISNPKIAICGGWIGTLSVMIFNNGVLCAIDSIDTDPLANKKAEYVNLRFKRKFKTVNQDMYSVDYSDYDIIINTSSEHIPNIWEWRKSLPPNKIVIVQNNNFKQGDGHISCVDSKQELVDALNFKKILYAGAKTFKVYSRYMVIGIT